jgi:MFS family permease
MTDNPSDATETTESKGIPNPITELVGSFRALKDAPRAFWYTEYAYWLDGVSYFGMLILLTMFFHDIAGLSDDAGHKLVSIYTGLITGTMLLFGPLSDRLGVRRSLIVSVILYIIGRAALPLAPGFLPPGSTAIAMFCLAALVVAAAGNGFMQPSCYAGVRKFTDEKTAAMGYGLLYAGMNLGIVVIGLISPRIRTGIHIGGLDFDGWGITGVFWFCVAVNVAMLLGLLFVFRPKKRAKPVQQAKRRRARTDRHRRIEVPEPDGWELSSTGSEGIRSPTRVSAFSFLFCCPCRRYSRISGWSCPNTSPARTHRSWPTTWRALSTWPIR